MSDLRAKLVECMKTVLTENSASMSGAFALSVPVGPLADAVIEYMSQGHGVPMVPDFDADLFAARRWFQPATSEWLMGDEENWGRTAPSVRVTSCPDPANSPTDTRPAVQLGVTGAEGVESVVDLLLPDAEELALCMLAVVNAGRSGQLPVNNSPGIDDPSSVG